MDNPVYTTWRDLIKGLFKSDPLKCSSCNMEMVLVSVDLPPPKPLINHHKKIAGGFYPLVSLL